MSDGIEPMGIKEGPYNGKPNPHAWMSTKNALIYVENIRKALAKPIRRTRKSMRATPAAYSEKIRAIDAPLRERLATMPADSAGWCRAKARSAISPATTAARSLSLADQR